MLIHHARPHHPTPRPYLPGCAIHRRKKKRRKPSLRYLPNARKSRYLQMPSVMKKHRRKIKSTQRIAGKFEMTARNMKTGTWYTKTTTPPSTTGVTARPVHDPNAVPSRPREAGVSWVGIFAVLSVEEVWVSLGRRGRTGWEHKGSCVSLLFVMFSKRQKRRSW